MARTENIRSKSQAPKQQRLPRALTRPATKCQHDGCRFYAIEGTHCARHTPKG